MTFWSLANSDFPTNQTFHQFHDLDTELDLHRLWVVSMEHLQRVWHASRERLHLRTPGSVPILGFANAPIVEIKILELAMSLLDFSPRIPLPILRLNIAYFAVAEGWLLLDIGWFVLFLVLSRFCILITIIFLKARVRIKGRPIYFYTL